MSRRLLRVKTHLTSEELDLAARTEGKSQVKIRILAIRYMLKGHTAAAAATEFGVSQTQVRQWVHRYNGAGLRGLGNLPRPGRRSFLPNDQVEAFQQRVLGCVSHFVDSSGWQMENIRRLLAEEFGANYSLSGTYRLLQRLELNRKAKALRGGNEVAEMQAGMSSMVQS